MTNIEAKHKKVKVHEFPSSKKTNQSKNVYNFISKKKSNEKRIIMKSFKNNKKIVILKN